MRALVDADRIRELMRALGREARSPAHVYFTGGATAVLLGWRASTIDVDIKIAPESDALLRAMPRLKDALDVNIELASPDGFIPVRDNWVDRSRFIGQEGSLTFHHFDLCAQALAKIERGHDQDVDDVREMLERGLIDRAELRDYFRVIEPKLYRFPAIDPAAFARAVSAVTDR